jgi:hypothetical protein
MYDEQRREMKDNRQEKMNENEDLEFSYATNSLDFVCYSNLKKKYQLRE